MNLCLASPWLRLGRWRSEVLSDLSLFLLGHINPLLQLGLGRAVTIDDSQPGIFLWLWFPLTTTKQQYSCTHHSHQVNLEPRAT